MDAHGTVLELLGAWAVGACDEGETAAVEAHIGHCGSCAAEARRLRAAAHVLTAGRVDTPPRGLRTSLLTDVRRRRSANEPSGTAVLGRLVDAYARQVASLDGLLSALDPAGWRLPDPRHGSIGGLVTHLTANDTALATELDLPIPARPAGTDPHAAWRTVADTLVRGLGSGTRGDAEVRLAGRVPLRRPLREAVIQRAFETWIHLDDVGAMLGRELAPPPADHVRHVVDFAVGLLPSTLAATGTPPAAGTARLGLTGEGGGSWTVALCPSGIGPEIMTLTAEATDFCRLAANRYTPAEMPHRATGDPALVAQVLHATSLLGCD